MNKRYLVISLIAFVSTGSVLADGLSISDLMQSISGRTWIVEYGVKPDVYDENFRLSFHPASGNIGEVDLLFHSGKEELWLYQSIDDEIRVYPEDPDQPYFVFYLENGEWTVDMPASMGWCRLKRGLRRQN